MYFQYKNLVSTFEVGSQYFGNLGNYRYQIPGILHEKI
jgi:hypothetical protein